MSFKSVSLAFPIKLAGPASTAPNKNIPSADQGTSDPEPEHKTAWGLNCREVAIQTFQLAIQTPAKLPLKCRLRASKKT